MLEQPLRFLRDLWENKTSTAAQQRVAFLQRIMQFTGPLTAKGVEDTSFYVYNALVSHNEVGDDPSAGPLSAEAFHELMLQRQVATPLSLNTSTTHDTKRGEDGRLRLNLLSLFPAEWQELVTSAHKGYDGMIRPTINDEYFIYQAIVAGFPVDGVNTTTFIQRLGDYLRKALREAKVNSSWDDPNEEYENVCIGFVRQLLSGEQPLLRSFMKRIDRYLPVYAPAQALLKITAPGIPDIYQGAELWDLSYVDPDNRRPVDYALRREWLSTMKQLEQENATALLQWTEDHAAPGAGKLLMMWKALQYRQQHPSLFTAGDYIPVYPDKPAPLIAYARQQENHWVLVVAPLLHRDIITIGHSLWKHVHLSLPAQCNGIGVDQITGQEYDLQRPLSVAQLFEQFPVALIGNAQGMPGKR